MLNRFLMKKALLTIVVMAIPALVLTAQGPASESYARVHISGMTDARLDTLKQTAGLRWWVQVEDLLLVLGERAELKAMARDWPLTVLDIPVREPWLLMIGLPIPPELDDAWVLAESGRWAVLQSKGSFLHLQHRAKVGCQHGVVRPFEPNRVLVRESLGPARQVRAKRAEIEALLAEINATRWYFDIYELQFFNRFSLQDGVDDARDWLVACFQAIEGLQVSTQTFDLLGRTGYNVVATLPGTTRPDEVYVVGAHYDSISENTALAAPGAEDNASGVAGVIEMARVFAAQPPEATIVFMAYSGEEVGLIGSAAHADQLLADGVDVRAALILDMISYTSDDDLDVLIETGSVGVPLLDVFENAAATYTDLRVLVSTAPFGSDHVPYLARGIPSVLSIQNEWNRYPGYHRTTDRISGVVPAMGLEILELNVAVLADLLNTAASD